MSKWRETTAMAEDEVDDFIAQNWSMVIGTVGRDGWPHLVTMAYGLIDGKIVFTSFSRAQKSVNLRRDPRITCLIEDPGTRHEEIRGIQVVGTAEISEDPDRAVAVLRAVKQQSVHGHRLPPGAEAPSDKDHATAAKRICVTVEPQRLISWDHTRLERESRPTYDFD